APGDAPAHGATPTHSTAAAPGAAPARGAVTPGAGTVRIVASGDRPLPGGLPGGAAGVTRAGGGGEVFRVGHADSDDLLRVLLGAGWHVHRVEDEGERV
ncbi:hypothetical protein ACWGBV_35715, partial [Streptomyces sp. NPDC055051]